MKLATFPGRQYDPNGTAKDFTTMVKVKPFNHQEDAFDDLFLQKETFLDVTHMASLPFALDDLESFCEYREKILLKVHWTCYKLNQ